MTNNVIDLFAKGNQELFHSAFIAWLLDENGSHGLKDRFLKEFKSKLPGDIRDRLPDSLNVLTEYQDGRLRYDILLKPRSKSANSFKGLVLENKIKSFCNTLQPKKYKAAGFDVVVLALLPETVDLDTGKECTVIDYSDINQILQGLDVDPADHYQFLVREYCDFLTQTLSTYESIRQYCSGNILLPDFRAKLKTCLSNSILRDNDIRTYSYYYYYLLAEYIGKSAPDLIFGTRTYAEAERDKQNTKWLFEKNVQGPPYIEAIIDCRADTPYWKLPDDLAQINETEPFKIAPRIEVNFDLKRILDAKEPEDPSMGKLMLGTWSPTLKEHLKNNESYKSKLNKLNARRNFHSESLVLSDIPFGSIVTKIRQGLQLIFSHTP